MLIQSQATRHVSSLKTTNVSHGKEELQGFLQHLNCIHQNIKFTVEVEKNNSISWYPATNMVKRYGDTLIRKQGQAKEAPNSAHQLPTGSCSESNKVYM
jgi:small nuclear ribonucleoprotein (snRNP)-like protein